MQAHKGPERSVAQVPVLVPAELLDQRQVPPDVRRLRTPQSGPANQPGFGAAGLPFPLPANPSLSGVRLGAQALLLDPRAPQGVSMTAALGVELTR